MTAFRVKSHDDVSLPGETFEEISSGFLSFEYG